MVLYTEKGSAWRSITYKIKIPQKEDSPARIDVGCSGHPKKLPKIHIENNKKSELQSIQTYDKRKN